ncbi:heme oxygenase 2 isoform X2 [Pleurodeles waltl]|uniref:heme oxygenase 2 isoform X2 n=1 Tax=Pleurodeles waltl TaxID=8319 RepID=UPI003709B938
MPSDKTVAPEDFQDTEGVEDIANSSYAEDMQDEDGGEGNGLKSSSGGVSSLQEAFSSYLERGGEDSSPWNRRISQSSLKVRPQSEETVSPLPGFLHPPLRDVEGPQRECHLKNAIFLGRDLGVDIETRPTDLSELLKEGTKDIHERAENTQFVKDFLKGCIKKELFKLATVALYYTYSALEEEIERNKDHPSFAPLYFPLELHRKDALEKDLAFFYGSGWRTEIQCSAAAQEYVERIRHLGQNEPELLVAHTYTRYMGDLSGGQVLKKVAQRALHLPNTGEGIQFYMFENVTNAQRFKQLYRARMNALELDSRTKERIVEEAVEAFHFNIKVFNELDKISPTLLEKAQEVGLRLHDGKGDIRKCPYYAANQGSSKGAWCPFHAGVSLLRLPSVQLILATVMAGVAGLVAWYVM